MNTRIRLSGPILLLACLTTACANGIQEDTAPVVPIQPDPLLSDTRQIDMLYRVDVQELGNDCSDAPQLSHGRAQLDAYPLPDGKLRFSLLGDAVPGPSVYTDIERNGGRIDHQQKQIGFVTKAAVAYHMRDGTTPIGRDFPTSTALVHRMHGTIDPDSLNLDLDVQQMVSDGPGKSRVCTRHIMLMGIARKLRDPKVIDGHYAALATETSVCPGYPDAVVDSFTIPVEVEDDAAIPEVKLGLDDDTIRLAIPRPISGAAWSTADEVDVMLLLDAGYTRYVGKTTGTITPDKLDLHIVFHDPTSKSPCRTVFDLKGKKILPSSTGMQNRFRMHTVGENSCGGTIDRNVTIDILTTPDGFELHDPDAVIIPLYPRPEGFEGLVAYHEGKIYQYHGKLEGDVLTYTSKTGWYDSKGTLCLLTLKADGHPRFTFP